MEEIALPTIQQGELDIGYAGRVSALNGFAEGCNLLAGLRATLGLHKKSRLAEVLAACAGMNSMEFMHRHSLLPALRAFSSHLGTKRESEILAKQAAGHNLSSRSSLYARACELCIKEDIEAGRTSHWRRSHHLPCVDWCPQHGGALLQFSSSAFQVRPMDAFTRLSVSHVGPESGVGSGDALDRYTQLLSTWLQRESTISTVAFNNVVKEGCRRHQLRYRPEGLRPTVSDLVRERFPEIWLQRHWPDVVAKQAVGAFVHRIDGAAKDRHVAYPGATCALVLAALFDSSQEAISLLDASNAQVLATMHGDTSNPQDNCKAAWNAFMRGGSLSSVCKVYGLPVRQLETWMRERAIQGLAVSMHEAVSA